MMLGRTIRLAGGEDVSLINPTWYTRIFVTADITTLIIQGLGEFAGLVHLSSVGLTTSGAGIMGTMKLHLALAGEKIVIAGLALQVATFIFFLVASIDFHIRMNRKSRSSTTASSAGNWKKMLWILYSVSALVLFRCTFRLIEYAMGNASYLIRNEWTLYTFDAVPMFLVLVLLLILQPSKYVPANVSKVDESSDSEMGVAQN